MLRVAKLPGEKFLYAPPFRREDARVPPRMPDIERLIQYFKHRDFDRMFQTPNAQRKSALTVQQWCRAMPVPDVTSMNSFQSLFRVFSVFHVPTSSIHLPRDPPAPDTTKTNTATTTMSWERARYIPWSRIPQGDQHRLEEDKERIFRELQREANDAAAAASPPDVAVSTPRLKENISWTKLPFSSAEFIKHTFFGGCVGSITGAVFGFVDSMRSAGEATSILKRASDAQKLKYVLQGATRSATVFGLFFGGFHMIKYGVHITADPGPFVEVSAAAAVSLGALVARPNLRSSIPYGMMLIVMDSVHVLMRGNML